MENYENLGTVGEGTYGIVMKCRHKETGQLVAIKKFKESDEDEQVKKTAMREVRILKQLRHDNIVNLIEIFRKKGKLYLVFEYLEGTILGKIEENPYGLAEEEVKKYMYQLLKGIQYCHMHNIIHRDIKPENLLVSRSGVLKLCDFGFARTLEGQGSKYTEYVSTRWYRAPELLVGDREYGKPVDIWAIGCMFAEIISGVPLFPGKSDIDQLFKIINCFGLISDRHKKIFQQNHLFQSVELPNPAEDELETLAKRFPGYSRQVISFLELCLHQEPDKRGTYEQLLEHPYLEGLDKWYNSDMKYLLQKDNLADFSKNKKQERSPMKLDKKNYSQVKLDNEEKRKKHQVRENNHGYNKENEINPNSVDILPNIRIQRIGALPLITDQKKEDIAIPPIGRSHSFIVNNGQFLDTSQISSLPTLSDFKYKPNKKKSNKRKLKGNNLVVNKEPNSRAVTPIGNTSDFYGAHTDMFKQSNKKYYNGKTRKQQ